MTDTTTSMLTREDRAEKLATEPAPAVYFAGPIDYVEHRDRAGHLVDNWRHRYFGDLRIRMRCPTCMNRDETVESAIMARNRLALDTADLFVGHFPADVATFGTPIEVWEWVNQSFLRQIDPGVLIHPAPKGIFVQHLESLGLTVVRSPLEARSWLQHLLMRR